MAGYGTPPKASLAVPAPRGFAPYLFSFHPSNSRLGSFPKLGVIVMLHINIVWSNGREEQVTWEASQLHLAMIQGSNKRNGHTVVGVEIVAYYPGGER